MADAEVSKTFEETRVGSTPTPGTNKTLGDDLTLQSAEDPHLANPALVT